VKRRLRALLRSERGHTLIELLTVVGILGTVMTGVTTMLVSGTRAELEMNQRFQAQVQARLALEQLRRDVHCASTVSPVGPAATITLTMPTVCPTSGGQTQITWCTVANGTNRWTLWRYPGSACSGTGKLVADYLTNATAFSYVAPTTASLAKVTVTIWVNIKPAQTQSTYKLTDDVVLRNSRRA
jgi:type II secretory pathway pseudopilin PulG